MKITERVLQKLIRRGAQIIGEQPAAPARSLAGLPVSAAVLAANPGLATTATAASKYHNTRIVVDEITFDSLAEATRYGELCLLVRAGQIADLRPNPDQPTKRRYPIGAGRHYTPDFTYTEGGQWVAEDVKGMAPTADSSLRMALFRERYPTIDLRLIRH